MAKNVRNHDIFVEHFRELLESQSFIKATLSKPRPESTLTKIQFSMFVDKNGEAVCGIDHFQGPQTTRTNIPLSAVLSTVLYELEHHMHAAHIQTSDADLLYESTAQGTVRFKQRPPSVKRVQHKAHNRQKQHPIPSSTAFLKHVGITDGGGTIRIERYDKYKQIQKYVELVSTLLRSSIKNTKSFRVVDFGSGKNYLTFALHHHLSSLFDDLHVVGVEQRAELVRYGEEIIDALSLKGISFVKSAIADYIPASTNLVVALHACDTATDDAIAQAIRANADYICLAPCCHKYVRSKMGFFDDLDALLQHGIIHERFSESLTDSLRVLVLESLGYKTNLFEFISAEHTAKNTMITACRIGKTNLKSLRKIHELRTKFKLLDFYLDRKLEDLLATVDSSLC